MPNTRAIGSVVVVGGGAAGFAAVEKLRRAGFHGSIDLVSTEPDVPADRTLFSKDYLAGAAEPDRLPLKPAGWYAENDVTLHLSTEATGLDTAGKTVTLADGTSLGYDALLLATGAEPSRPPLPGFGAGLVVRTKADADAVIAAATDGARVVVVGSSFIGLEVAASLRTRGLDVTVVGQEEVPLANRLGDEVAAVVKKAHEDNGVTLLTGEAASWGSDGLTLKDGTVVPGDVLVVGAGVQPRLDLAEAAGLTVEEGVVVDAFGETSAPGVFAAGDIAQFPWNGSSIRVEHWAVAQRAGALAAVNMLGAEQPMDEPPFFWSKHVKTNIRYSGHAGSLDSTSVERGDDGALLVTVTEGGTPTAFIGVKSDHRVLELEDEHLRP